MIIITNFEELSKSAETNQCQRRLRGLIKPDHFGVLQGCYDDYRFLPAAGRPNPAKFKEFDRNYSSVNDGGAGFGHFQPMKVSASTSDKLVKLPW